MGESITLPLSSVWANRKCLLLCTIVSMANFQFGLDSGVVGALQAMPGFLAVYGFPTMTAFGPGFGIDSTFQQLITSFPILGALFSSLAAGYFSVFFGRKVGLWAACLITAVGVAIQMGTDNKGAIYVGRIVLGVGNGFLVTFSNMYCAEVAPAHLRHIMVGLSTEWILIGSIVAAAITNETQSRLDKSSYQISLGSLLILPVVLAIGLFFVPESPRYLLTRGQTEAATKSLETLRGDSLQPEELELERAEIVKGIEEEQKVAATVGPLDMFKGTDLRRTLIAFGTAAADSGCTGAWFIIPYNTYFMIISGITPQKAFDYFLIQTCCGLVACNIGLFVMRFLCGRRTFLMLSAVFNGLFMLGLGVSSTVSTSLADSKTLTAVFVSFSLVWYSFGTGVATRPVATELVSTRLRAWSFGATQAVSQLLIWLVSFCTPYFINPTELNWGGKYAYFFAGASFISVAWYYFFLPETKGRTLEEIDELFEKRVATLEFSKFQTTILDQAHEELSGRHSSSGEKASTQIEETSADLKD